MDFIKALVVWFRTKAETPHPAITPGVTYRHGVCKQNPNRGARHNFHVVIVDDNMSLRSMRRSFYQLAGEHQLGFCVLHVRAAASECKDRNRRRDPAHRVPEAVRARMDLQIEAPDPEKFPWEKLGYLIVQSVQPRPSEGVEPLSTATLAQARRIEDLIVASWRMPPPNLSEMRLQRTREREVSQRASSESTRHQCELQLRRMIGAAIKAVEPVRRGVMARQLNALKKNFVKQLRTAHDPEKEIEDLRVELASMTGSA